MSCSRLSQTRRLVVETPTKNAGRRRGRRRHDVSSRVWFQLTVRLQHHQWQNGHLLHPSLPPFHRQDRGRHQQPNKLTSSSGEN